MAIPKGSGRKDRARVEGESEGGGGMRLARGAVLFGLLGTGSALLWLFLWAQTNVRPVVGASSAAPEPPDRGAEDPPEPERGASVEAASVLAQEAAPTAEPAAAPPGREALPEAFGGVLRDPSGVPLAGAELTWTALAPELEGREYLRDVDPQRVRALSLAATTDGRGRFRFEGPPAELAHGPAVLWITHAGQEAMRVAFVDPGERARWNGSVACVERAPVHVRVTRAGQPVGGARVVHQLSFWGGEPPAAERALRRVFLREYTSGADGALELVPGPLENVLQAFLGSEQSVLLNKDLGANVELELVPSVSARGFLRVEGLSSVELRGVRYSLAALTAPDGSDGLALPGSQPVRADGSFGPDPWPRVERERLRITTFGGDFVSAQTETSMPAADGTAVFELATRLGSVLELVVHDERGAPLGDAQAQAFRPQSGTTIFAARATSDEAGRLRLAGLPAGQVQVDVTKPGFTSQHLYDQRVLLPRAAEGALEVLLRPAATLTGSVRSAGQPVSRFWLYGWSESRSFELYSWIQDEAGAFRLTDVPRGETVYLYAFNETLPQSETAMLVLGEEPASVILELPQPRRARGRVVDSLTGEPIASATVTHATTGETGLATYRGSPMRVGADGSFELEGFFPGRGGFAVQAAGYESLNYSTREDEGEVIDVGLLPMNPLCRLELFVREEGVADYSGYHAWNRCSDNQEPRALRPDGTLELASNTGRYLVVVARPDGTVVSEEGLVLPGETGVVELDLGGRIELAATVPEPPRGTDGSPDGNIPEDRLHVTWREGGRDRHQEARRASEQAAFLVRGLVPGDAMLELRDARGTTRGLWNLRLTREPHQTCALELGGEPRRLRLVDERGEPWAARTATVWLEDGSGWYLSRNTDAAGELVLGPLSATHLRLAVKLANESIAFGRRVELTSDPRDTTEVTIEAGERVHLLLEEAGRAIPGVHLAFRHAGGPNTIEFTYASDEHGLIKGPFCSQGEYELRVNQASYWPPRIALPIRAEGRSPSSPVAIELYSLGSLTLRALGDGQPVAGARLELVHESLGSLADWVAAGWLEPRLADLASASDGTLRLEGVPRGHYAWTARAPGWKPASGTLELSARGAAEATARLQREE